MLEHSSGNKMGRFCYLRRARLKICEAAGGRRAHLGTKKDRFRRSFLVPRWALLPPAASRLPPRGRLGVTPRPPPVSVFPLRWRFPVYRPSCLRSRAHGRLHVTPRHGASNKNCPFCSRRNAPARRRERFQGFLLLAGHLKEACSRGGRRLNRY